MDITMNEIFKYEVGQTIENFRNHQEGVQFDMSDSGATLLVFFYNPTQDEIEQFKAGKNFEIRFTELYGIIMITVKIGNLDWMDAPYSPHLSRHLTKFTLPQNNEGLALTLMLIDAASGQIKHMRLIGLSQKFTQRLFGVAMERKVKEFNGLEYGRTINKIYNLYSTNQIVKMSSDYCVVNN